MQTPLKAPSIYNQFVDLTLIQLSNWRWSWRGMLITSTLAPALSTLALGFFARDAGPRALGYILAGNLVLALMFGVLDKVASNFAFMRARGMLGYFATLPLHGYTLILATVMAFFLLSLPSVVITLLFGAFYLDLPFHVKPVLLLILPLIAASLAGLGALIGTAVKTPEEAGSLSLFISLVLMGLGPVLAPPERLPDLLVFLGWFSPATYAASALRQALLGPLTARLWLDLGVLLLLALLLLWLVGRVMNWRGSDI